MSDTRSPIPLNVGARGGKDPVQAARDNHTRRMGMIAATYDGQIDVAENSVSTLSDDWDIIQADEGGRYPSYSSPWFYWPFMIVLAICEAPVNRLSFELFFAESPILSLGVSLLVGTILISLAHSMGIIARRFRYNARFALGALVASGQLAFVTGLVAMICYGVAVLRQGYLAFLTRPDPSLAQLIESEQIGQAALVALRASLAIEGWIFLFINLGIVAVGLLAAFFCHDPHPSFEKFDRAKKRAERSVKSLALRRAAAIASEERRYASHLKRLGV